MALLKHIARLTKFHAEKLTHYHAAKPQLDAIRGLVDEHHRVS